MAHNAMARCPVLCLNWIGNIYFSSDMVTKCYDFSLGPTHVICAYVVIHFLKLPVVGCYLIELTPPLHRPTITITPEEVRNSLI